MIRIEHQESVCLKGSFESCPVFLAQGKLRVPVELVEPDLNRKTRILRATFWALVGLLLVVAAGMTYYFRDNLQSWINPPGTILQALTPYAAPSVFASPQPTDSYQPGMLSQPPFLANTRTPGPQPSDTAIPDIRNPLEERGSLVIHEILEGESLDYLANQYKTTVEAIRDINANLNIPLWAGEMMVIPQGIKDTSLLPVFETAYISQKKSLKNLAQEYNVEVKLLKLYNSSVIITSRDQEIILGEQWVLLPRPREAGGSP